jgi:hypothetical protein
MRMADCGLRNYHVLDPASLRLCGAITLAASPGARHRPEEKMRNADCGITSIRCRFLDSDMSVVLEGLYESSPAIYCWVDVGEEDPSR